ncbi:hypothetical protein [Acinetobacter sp. Ac_5812]|uniref:hypothetical protein n=1 Tax=Acinetobacter sp. Ac_5812 TaxID=1848937 RepID=UPI00148F5DEA|nr:hypothetical protein [Acinetobacter sp. Ac_5812]NNP67199.1 hypothetical protein [Acinetobacter sp. Ac_5812]
MEKLWVGSDDVFFQAVFAYLKRKFEVRFTALAAMQNNTEKSIYHESIVALENVHEVLRKIENSAAPTREDYEKACKENNEKQKQDIIDFYKKLVILNDQEFDAFQNFRRHYWFDSTISRYSVFLDEYLVLDADEDRRSEIIRSDKGEQKKSFDKLSRVARAWEQQRFDANNLFQFIEGYQAMLSLSSLPTDHRRYQSIKESIDQQNDLYVKLVGAYEDLTATVQQIGVSVVDIIVPYNLRSYESRPEFLSTELFAKVVLKLEEAFRHDDGILLFVNHAHVRNNHHFVLSYLVIYKAKNYKNPTKVFDWIQARVRWIVGEVYDRVKVVNRETMLKSLYPEETFVGVLSSKKQKMAFRDKFLRYFMSSIFLVHLDEGEELVYWKMLKNITLNDYIFYKEKIYIDDEKIEQKANNSKNQIDDQVCDELSITHLRELVDHVQVDHFFSNKDLPTAVISQLELIKFLYRQQSITTVRESAIENLIKIEAFLMRLLYLPVYEFSKAYQQKDFERVPKFNKLSLVFQQFVLILKMDCFARGALLPRELNSKAIHFVNQFRYSRKKERRSLRKGRDFLKKNYRISETYALKRNLETYKCKLRSLVQYEQKAMQKYDKKRESIQEYLAQIFKKDVVILRFIFKCGQLGSSEVKLFNDMFTDYSNNLKRRYTAGFRLAGQVGIYIPHRQEHYIDATLIFQNDQQISDAMKAKRDIEKLKDEVARYWENYVENKWDQIQWHQKKQKNSKFKSEINPFRCFANHRLSAWSEAVVKTEPSLDRYMVEIFQGQSKIQKLCIEKIASYYAYSPVILVEATEYKSMPRTSCLILGRVREPRQKIASMDDSNSYLEQQENPEIEDVKLETNTETAAQPAVLLPAQAKIVTEPNVNILSVKQAYDEQVANKELLQDTESNELDKSITLTINLEEEHGEPIEENMKMDGKIEVRRKQVFAKPIRNRSKG